MRSVQSDDDLSRLKWLWCKGIATAEQIEQCKAMERRDLLKSRSKIFLLAMVLLCLFFSLTGAISGLVVGLLLFGMEGAELTHFVTMHTAHFAKFSVVFSVIIILIGFNLKD